MERQANSPEKHEPLSLQNQREVVEHHSYPRTGGASIFFQPVNPVPEKHPRLGHTGTPALQQITSVEQLAGHPKIVLTPQRVLTLPTGGKVILIDYFRHGEPFHAVVEKILQSNRFCLKGADGMNAVKEHFVSDTKTHVYHVPIYFPSGTTIDDEPKVWGLKTFGTKHEHSAYQYCVKKIPIRGIIAVFEKHI